MNKVFEKILEADKKLKNFYTVFHCYDIRFLDEIFSSSRDKYDEEATEMMLKREYKKLIEKI